MSLPSFTRGPQTPQLGADDVGVRVALTPSKADKPHSPPLVHVAYRVPALDGEEVPSPLTELVAVIVAEEGPVPVAGRLVSEPPPGTPVPAARAVVDGAVSGNLFALVGSVPSPGRYHLVVSLRHWASESLPFTVGV